LLPPPKSAKSSSEREPLIRLMMPPSKPYFGQQHYSVGKGWCQ